MNQAVAGLSSSIFYIVLYDVRRSESVNLVCIHSITEKAERGGVVTFVCGASVKKCRILKWGSDCRIVM